MGRLMLAFAVATLAAVAGLQLTHAQEPLFLRIRPAGILSDEEVARQARLAREAVWTRSDQRARRHRLDLRRMPPVGPGGDGSDRDGSARGGGALGRT